MKHFAQLSVVSLVLCLHSVTSFSLDHMYSQSFNSPPYLNPALTGALESDLRMNLTFQNRYTSTPGIFSHDLAPTGYNVPRNSTGHINVMNFIENY